MTSETRAPDGDDLLATTLTDGENYEVTARDLEFLGVNTPSVEAMIARRFPLGMTQDTYTEFAEGLHHALERENATDADVRIQGSSAHFFSGWHKRLPDSREQVTDLYSMTRKRPPSRHELDQCCSALFGQWPSGGPRPNRRPFDSMAVVGVDPSPSDYDVQISSDKLIEIIRGELRYLGNDDTKIQAEHSTYAFVHKHYAEEFLVYLSTWASRATDLVGRPVTWALFPSAGPARNPNSDLLSSHFKPTDWIVARPGPILDRVPGEE